MNLNDLAAQIRTAVEQGLEEAAEHVLAESNRRVPTEQRDLKASGTVSTGPLSAAVSYDTPYAVVQHERQDLAHDPGRQAKFLETAGNSNREEILQIVAERIRRVL